MVPAGPPQADISPAAVPFSAKHNAWWDMAWRWRDVEISRLEALVSDASIRTETTPGIEKDLVELLERLRATDRHEPMGRLFEALLGSDELVDALAEVEGASEFSSLVELARQRRGVKALRAVINNPLTTRDELANAIRSEWWIFGGRYIPPIGRERIPVLQQVDLPLIRSDGAIHVVALGPANVEDLVVSAEDGYRVGSVVQDLVNRAINQLLTLETQALAIRDLFDVESRRAFATVVVGHTTYATELPEGAVRNTLRTYSSHLAGIEILTYKELIDGAEKTLTLFERRVQDPYGAAGSGS